MPEFVKAIKAEYMSDADAIASEKDQLIAALRTERPDADDSALNRTAGQQIADKYARMAWKRAIKDGMVHIDDAPTAVGEALQGEDLPDTPAPVSEATDDNPPAERIAAEQTMLQLSNRGRMRAEAGEVDGPERYVEWSSADSVPDPRIASRTQLASLLEEVVRHEGPVVAIRAYRVINRASGRQRLTSPARRALNRARAAAVRAGNVVVTNPLDLEDQAQLVLRSPESPGIILRERGPRELDELPPDEVAMMLRVLREADGTTETEALKRQVLDQLGWVRLTRNVDEFLDQCMALM